MRREKAGLLATAMEMADSGTGYFRAYKPRPWSKQDAFELSVDASLNCDEVVDYYHAAVQELRVACSTEAAYPEL